ncbi:SRPBCC domain-containing protein [Paenibacillus sp. N1-5-1-14]|uniref:SRPBCC family protein n=1 Tax=Paenibacillus radicibacter TaxID=2972488 RepID=UPI0021596C91|nr:SRPBCC domain-containing protein [Paenibacillus radicibacter]MCR8643284.1 SRPBCC domain-containing protein [Paenibacillus radicibacter]
MEIIRKPDLSLKPYNLQVERQMAASPEVIYRAWTKQIGSWFAAPDSVLMQGIVNTPFFFETEFNGSRHPHYGRFLRLVEDRLIELTWVTGAGGTKGAETVVTVEIEPSSSGSRIILTHAGFPDEESRDGHEQAWPFVLEQLDLRMTSNLS